MIKKIVYLSFVFYVVASCKQKATAPSYLKINNFKVTTNITTQGTSVQTINEAMIYIDDLSAGVYHLPAMVPLAMNGNHKVTIVAAVVENAIASNKRYAYNFLTSFDTTVNFITNNTIEIEPKITYRTTVKFEMIEDFENPLPLIGKTVFNTIDTLLRDSLPEDNIESGHCALFEIPYGDTMEYATRNKYSLPTASYSETFLEINYKTELALAIGLYITEPNTIIKTGVVTLNPKTTWSKAYINLTNDVSVKPPGTKFQIFISSLNPDGSTKKVFVDNIKIIHFE